MRYLTRTWTILLFWKRGKYLYNILDCCLYAKHQPFNQHIKNLCDEYNGQLPQTELYHFNNVWHKQTNRRHRVVIYNIFRKWGHKNSQQFEALTELHNLTVDIKTK